jgi:hypothetical protein
LDISFGAIGAAAIGAVVSLLTLIISKEGKTSEFRQAWIDALRSDIAEAISKTSLLLMILYDRHENGETKGLNETFAQTSAALARIELRLNLLEEDHVALRDLVREAEEMIGFAEDGVYDPVKAADLSNRTVHQTQIILKKEWDRVRRGEATFQLTKSCAALILLGSVYYALLT